MSNFTDVAFMNKVFRTPVCGKENPNWEELQSAADLVFEESGEMQDGIDEKNLRMIIDAIGDTLVVTYGVAYRLGIDADKLMKNIYDSNMSKLCKDYETAEQTVQSYSKQGIPTHIEESEVYPGKFIIRCSETVIIGEKIYPKNKFLKSIDFFEPDTDV